VGLLDIVVTSVFVVVLVVDVCVANVIGTHKRVNNALIQRF